MLSPPTRFSPSAIDAVGLTRWKCRNAMERQETQRLGNKPPHNDSDTRKRCSTAAVGIDKEVGVGQGRINTRQPYRTGTSTGRKKGEWRTASSVVKRREQRGIKLEAWRPGSRSVARGLPKVNKASTLGLTTPVRLDRGRARLKLKVGAASSMR